MGRIKKNELSAYFVDLLFILSIILFLAAKILVDVVISQYLHLLALGAIILFAAIKLGFMRDRGFIRMPATRMVLCVLLSSGIISYALGIFLGFNYGYKISSLKVFASTLLPEVCLAVEIELIRYVMSHNFATRPYAQIIFTLASIVLYVILAYSKDIFASGELMFIFICKTVLVVIAREAACAFINFRAGLLPALVFKLTIISYAYILPIVPDLGDYLYCVMNLLTSFFAYLLVSRLEVDTAADRRRAKTRSFSILAIPTMGFSLMLAILVTGVFQYKIIAIASNSMKPVYERGDAVIYEKVSAQNIQKGDILVYEKQNRVITHRVVEIINSQGQLSFITKGDANNGVDSWTTEESEVLGRVVLTTKYIGLPTVWLSEQLK